MLPRIIVVIFVLSCPFIAVGQKKDQSPGKIICPTIRRPKLVLQVSPIYPKEAKQAGIEGKVSLRCIIGTDGSVQEIEVTKGEEPFVQAAKTAVSQWKYEPIRLNGAAVQFDTTVDVIFQIPKKESKGSESGIHSSP